MNKKWFPAAIPHAVAVLIFLIAAVGYCWPAFKGAVLQQHDVTQWKAMAQYSMEYKARTGHLPLWTPSMFGGMPAYQIAMEGDTILSPGWLLSLLTLGLPAPASFFFLASVCFYILTVALRVRNWAGILGALAFAYATYNPIIIGAGHNTKMIAIALMPLLTAGLVWIYEKYYWIGAAVTAFGAALLIGANHFQIAYYLIIALAGMTIAYLIRWIRLGEYKHAALAIAIAFGAGTLGLVCNAVNLLTTYEYQKESIRGGSALPATSGSSAEGGLSKSYAFSYSLYKSEPFVMLFPKIYGGSSGLEMKEEKSKAIEALQAMPPELGQQLQGFLGAYWGGIGGTSGPPYVGASLCFLALLGFFLLDGKHKWWIAGVTALTIMMSWGGFFEGFNGALLKYLPFYNKFRAPSMILVIPAFLIAILATLTLDRIVREESRATLLPAFKKGLLLNAGVVVAAVLVSFGFDYLTTNDAALKQQVTGADPAVQGYIASFFDGLKEDRKGLWTGSLMRSLLYMALAAGAVWAYLRRMFSPGVLIGALTLLVFVDLMSINVDYLNSDKYQEVEEYSAQFLPTPADQQIMADTGYYRVLDLRQGVQSALGLGYTLPSYFHLNVGGYHAAKLSIYQDLIENQLSRFPESMNVYNMLNTKYVIQPMGQGRDTVIQNAEALGAAWFVKAVRNEASPQAVMNALGTLNTRDTAIVFAEAAKGIAATAGDSLSSIRLVKADAEEMVYESVSTGGGFAVFSEVYYKEGWTATIDDKSADIVRTNYVLRGLQIPAGKHTIRFEFKPASFHSGIRFSNIGNIGVTLLLLAAIAMTVRKYRKRNSPTRVQPEVKKG